MNCTTLDGPVMTLKEEDLALQFDGQPWVDKSALPTDDGDKTPREIRQIVVPELYETLKHGDLSSQAVAIEVLLYSTLDEGLREKIFEAVAESTGVLLDLLADSALSVPSRCNVIQSIANLASVLPHSVFPGAVKQPKDLISDLVSLVQLESADAGVKRCAVQALCNLATDDVTQHRFVDCNGIDIVCDFLTTQETISVCMDVCRLFCNLSHDEEMALELVDAGALDLLTHACRLHDPEGRRLACKCLANIACSEKTIYRLWEAHVFECFIGMLQDPEPEIRVCVCCGISNMTHNRKIMRDAHTVTDFADLLHMLGPLPSDEVDETPEKPIEQEKSHSNGSAIEEAVCSEGSQSQGAVSVKSGISTSRSKSGAGSAANEEIGPETDTGANQEKPESSAGVDYHGGVAVDPSEEPIIFAAVQAICNLSTLGSRNRAVLLDGGVIQRMFTIFLSPVSPSIRIGVLWCLGNLASEENGLDILGDYLRNHEAVLPTIIDMCLGGDSAYQEATARLLLAYSLVLEKSKIGLSCPQTRKSKDSCLHALLRVARMNDPRSRVQICAALASLTDRDDRMRMLLLQDAQSLQVILSWLQAEDMSDLLHESLRLFRNVASYGELWHFLKADTTMARLGDIAMNSKDPAIHGLVVSVLSRMTSQACFMDALLEIDVARLLALPPPQEPERGPISSGRPSEEGTTSAPDMTNADESSMANQSLLPRHGSYEPSMVTSQLTTSRTWKDDEIRRSEGVIDEMCETEFPGEVMSLGTARDVSESMIPKDGIEEVGQSISVRQISSYRDTSAGESHEAIQHEEVTQAPPKMKVLPDRWTRDEDLAFAQAYGMANIAHIESAAKTLLGLACVPRLAEIINQHHESNILIVSNASLAVARLASRAGVPETYFATLPRHALRTLILTPLDDFGARAKLLAENPERAHPIGDSVDLNVSTIIAAMSCADASCARLVREGLWSAASDIASRTSNADVQINSAVGLVNALDSASAIEATKSSASLRDSTLNGIHKLLNSKVPKVQLLALQACTRLCEDHAFHTDLVANSFIQPLVHHTRSISKGMQAEAVRCVLLLAQGVDIRDQLFEQGDKDLLIKLSKMKLFLETRQQQQGSAK